MSIQTPCPHCHQACPAPARGKRVRCGNCHQIFGFDDGRPFRAPRPHKRLSAEEQRRRELRRQIAFGGALLLLFLSVPLIVLTFLGTFDTFLFSRVTAENFDQIEVGMKEKAVMRLMGKATFIDSRAVPQLRGPISSKYTIKLQDYPRRFFWRKGNDVIWVDMYNGKVKRCGATLDGERFGIDPEKVKPTDPDPPPEGEEKSTFAND